MFASPPSISLVVVILAGLDVMEDSPAQLGHIGFAKELLAVDLTVQIKDANLIKSHHANIMSMEQECHAAEGDQLQNARTSV